MSSDRRWNLNIHHHSIVLGAVPVGATLALDAGCGDGFLSFDLADLGVEVTGIDLDAPSLERARRNPRASSATTFVDGDLLTHPLKPGSFDVVASVAMLHHIDARSGLRRMKELVRPGGVVVVIGFAMPDGPVDRALMAGGVLFKTVQQLRGRYWEHSAPVSWPPPTTTTEMRDLVAKELPDASFRRRMSNRFSIVWRAPLA